MLGAITSSIQPVVSRATTTAEVWHTLASTYAKPSRAHIKQVRNQMKLWTKGTHTIDEYFQGFTVRIDQLAILGKPLDLEDQIEFILEGLPEEYKQIVDQVEGRDTPPSLTELHERLLNHEIKLLSAAPPSHLPVSANVAYNTNNNNSRNTPRHNNSKQYNNINQQSNWNDSNQRQHNRSGNRQPCPYLGRCQICSTQGHSARRCPQLQFMQHNASPFPATATMPWQPRANAAMVSPYSANNWLLDSGATHHITNDLNNLALHQPCQGGDGVLIGDGSPLAFSHTGSTLLSSPTRSLTLDKILCVPDIQKNLISVYRLCNANQVSVEFFPASFQVKDLSTGALFFKAEPGMNFMNGL